MCVCVCKKGGGGAYFFSCIRSLEGCQNVSSLVFACHMFAYAANVSGKLWLDGFVPFIEKKSANCTQNVAYVLV